MNPIQNALGETGLAALGRPLLYRARDAYFQARALPNRWHHRAVVGDFEVSFPTSNWFEYRRAKHLAGERTVLEALLSDLDGDEVVWDVGANVGMYTCFVAQALPSGLVVGFEPEPANLGRLRTNLASNAPRSTWRTRGVALSDRDGTTRLASDHRPADPAAPGTGHYYLSDSEGTEVACRRGETLVAEGCPAPDVLKIDVQGSEHRVLDGLGDHLARVERIYAELHTEKCRRYGTTVEAVEATLESAGFSLSTFGEPDHSRTGVYHVLASR